KERGAAQHLLGLLAEAAEVELEMDLAARTLVREPDVVARELDVAVAESHPLHLLRRAEGDEQPLLQVGGQGDQSPDRGKQLLVAVGADDELATAVLDRAELEGQPVADLAELLCQLIGDRLAGGPDCEEVAGIPGEPLPEPRLGRLAGTRTEHDLSSLLPFSSPWFVPRRGSS